MHQQSLRHLRSFGDTSLGSSHKPICHFLLQGDHLSVENLEMSGNFAVVS